MEKIKVLFVCVHNSARSQMAEAFLNQIAGDRFEAESAGLEPASAERCPVSQGLAKRLNWSFQDPASFTGTHEEKLAKTRIVRDNIKSEVQNFLNTYHLVSY